MAERREISAVYTAGVIQGIALVTFAAVSSVFQIAPYSLSNTEYGGMSLPQAVTAILSSLLGAGLTRKIGAKRVLLLGLTADLLSMLLLFASYFMTGVHPVAYALLLGATGFLGIGFGFVVPSINTFTAAFFPKMVDQAILTLNALLGLGTALAPIFAAIFVGLGIWLGLPILMSALSLGLLLYTMRLPLTAGSQAGADESSRSPSTGGIPPRFWVYAAFALLYGVCETTNWYWAILFMGSIGASPTFASFALTLFWGTVTGGRVLFAFIGKWCPPRVAYRALPVIIALAFAATACTPKGHPLIGLFTFGLAGLGCSAMLPLVISFSQGELTTMSASVAGGMIGFYQIGFGIGAFGVGPLQSLCKLSLSAIYGWTILPAVLLTVLAFIIVGKRSAQVEPLADPA
jgi:predicted MFS family arabinose efflux permease